MKTPALLLGLALSASASAQDLESAVNRTLGLADSDVQKLDLVGSPSTGLTVPLLLEGTPTQLALRPHSVRTNGFELLEQRADGSTVSVAPAPVTTMRGALESHPDARVAGSLLDDGFYARIMMADGSEYWIQPVPATVPGADPAHHVVYERDDVLRTNHFCGADLLANNFGQPGFEEAPGNTAMGTTLFTTELACDADYEFYLDYGSSTTNVGSRIETVIGTMNLQYESEVSITHEITSILVRTSSNQPYTSSDASTLLNQFRNEWNSNQGGIQRDVAQLFSGKSIDGGTIGIAWVGAICTSYGYGMVESDFNNNFASATDLSAHELGHNWNAQHCSCTSYTMNPYITSANTFNPNVTRGTITSFRDSRSCLSGGGGGGGGGGGIANDDCASAETITAGSTAFSTVGATNSGVSWPCAGGGGPDAWYAYTATSAADVTIDTCGSGYDTALQVFVGSCGALSQVACNDDACGLQSQIDLTGLSAGTTILIQVGGYSGNTGSGTLTVTESSTPPPGQPGNPTPSNGASAVSVNQDLSWGAASGASSYDVYFGTSASLGSGDLQGNQSGTSYALGTLAFSTTYYWRIDAVNGSGTTTGQTWSFTTEADTIAPPGQPGSPTPSNGATAVSIGQDLAWGAASGADSYDVYFGTDPTPDGGEFQGNQGGTSFALGTLQYSTTYYWRVDAVNAGGTTSSAVWSFTTEDDPNAGGETVIFADSFDGSISSAWSSNRRVRVRSGSAFAGSGGVRIKRSQYLQVTVNASGFTGLRLESARRSRNLDNGETFRIIVNGTTVETLTGSSGWRSSDIDLSAFAGASSLTVRFQVSANRNNETGDIDEVRIVGIN